MSDDNLLDPITSELIESYVNKELASEIAYTVSVYGTKDVVMVYDSITQTYAGLPREKILASSIEIPKKIRDFLEHSASETYPDSNVGDVSVFWFLIFLPEDRAVLSPCTARLSYVPVARLKREEPEEQIEVAPPVPAPAPKVSPEIRINVPTPSKLLN